MRRNGVGHAFFRIALATASAAVVAVASQAPIVGDEADTAAGPEEGGPPPAYWVVPGPSPNITAASGAGDVNGDGFDDLIIADYIRDIGGVNAGAAFLYYGSATGPPSSPAWTFEGSDDFSFMGRSVAGAGDVNGDGFDDVIVGQTGFDAGEAGMGAAHFFSGSASGLPGTPTLTLTPPIFPGERFGGFVATAGDVNGDGFDDVLVSDDEAGAFHRGTVYLYPGSAAGLASIPTWWDSASPVFSFFGHRMASLGDVNGDGFDDVAITSEGSPDQFVYVYHGSADWLGEEPVWVYGVPRLDNFTPLSVGSAGDVNGDGFDDLAMGQRSSNTVAGPGHAWVFHGSATGLSVTPDWTVSGELDHDSFGTEVGTAGDLNGDGYDELVVSDVRSWVGGPGRVFVYPGSSAGLEPLPIWGARGTGDTNDDFGRQAGSAGDINGDGVPDVFASSVNVSYFMVFFGPELCHDQDYDGDALLACVDDCNDLNKYCRFDCTDADGDNVCAVFDCDDGNPLCEHDCTDADADGYCVTTDCFDASPLCTTDCELDADGDQVPFCADCDDSLGFCRFDCTDQDGDERCVDFDCDDQNPNCGFDCTDQDSDGWCNAFDCNIVNPFCNSDCTDVDSDGYCITADCDDNESFCSEDCTDLDGDDWCVTFDCDDAVASCTEDCSDVDGDGIGGCYGDCDDFDPTARPGLVELCTDDVDNDCNGLEDDADPACSGLVAADLSFEAGPPTTISWSPAVGADSDALYRGRIPRSGFAGYNHLCEATEVGGGGAIDRDRPEPDEAFYYLVAGQALQAGPPEAFKAGPLGRASDGSSRPDATAITCGRRVRVDPDAVVGSNDGLSWATAYTSVGSALNGTGFAARGLEVWVRGIASGSATIDAVDRPAVRILGGFAGTELESWERDPQSTPTVWEVGTENWILEARGASVVLDGITLRNGGSGLLGLPAGAWTELTDVRFEQVAGYGADLRLEAAAELRVRDSRSDAGGLGGLRVVQQAGTLSGAILRSRFDGGSGDAVVLEARPTTADAEIRIDVVGNTVSGGLSGLVLGAYAIQVDWNAAQRSFVGSNLIHGTTGSPIRVEASGVYSASHGPAEAFAQPLVVGNTLSDGGAAGIVCTATRTGPAQGHPVEATPELWDNLITFNSGPGVEESVDNALTGLVADPRLVGNDLFGNSVLYLDEGIISLLAIPEVNALVGAYDNFADDPLYQDRPSGDYHLSSGQNQSAIDSGHTEAPRIPKLDHDGDWRIRDGDGDEIGRTDAGSDERWP